MPPFTSIGIYIALLLNFYIAKTTAFSGAKELVREKFSKREREEGN